MQVLIYSVVVFAAVLAVVLHRRRMRRLRRAEGVHVNLERI